MILLQLSDFKGGKYDIPDSVGVYTASNVQKIIDSYEKNYIYQLLGVEMGDLIIAYLAANRLPTNAQYDKIIDPFAMDSTNSCCDSMLQSQGLKEYLKAAIFYEYIKNGLITSQPGVTKPEAETATQQGPSSTMRFAENKFNDILDTVDAIQWYCINNPAATDPNPFIKFKGKSIKVKASNIL